MHGCDQHLGLLYRDALVSLMTQRGSDNRTADKALIELDGLDPLPIEGIAKGLSRKDVVDIDALQIIALTLLHQHGLTAAHLRSHPLPNFGFEHYRDALVNLMTQRGPNNKTADQAMAEINAQE